MSLNAPRGQSYPDVHTAVDLQTQNDRASDMLIVLCCRTPHHDTTIYCILQSTVLTFCMCESHIDRFMHVDVVVYRIW